MGTGYYNRGQHDRGADVKSTPPQGFRNRGGGKGLPPRFRRSGLSGTRSRAAGEYPADCHSVKEWSAVVDSTVSCVRCEVMTSCHDFIFI